ncbi:MAG: helix-turn-helix domain-containing protein, partial [Bacilli bacterium]
MEIGTQIRKYRSTLGFSQDALAEKIYVTRQTISNWENAKNYPDVKSLVLLSTVFDVSLDTLIKGDLERMKEEIRTEDVAHFKQESTIFSWLMI